ncbi:uncharacterized protein LOC123006891 [Tribolium madens]|nr:uncharacterized protein LOC123006891 [Tribolium madens]
MQMKKVCSIGMRYVSIKTIDTSVLPKLHGVHLPNEQDIMFEEDEDLERIEELARKPSKLMGWRVNNPTLGEFCFAMIGRADIEGSKSNVAMNAWLPQASYPCGNFSDTSSFKLRRSKGSIGHAFTVRIRTGNQNQTSFYPFVPHEISVLVELILGHLRYLLTDVPPQPNSPPDNVFRPDRPGKTGPWSQKEGTCPASDPRNK